MSKKCLFRLALCAVSLGLSTAPQAGDDRLTRVRGKVITLNTRPNTQLGIITLKIGHKKPRICSIEGTITGQNPERNEIYLTHWVVCSTQDSFVTEDVARLNNPLFPFHVRPKGTIDYCRLDVTEEDHIVSGTGKFANITGQWLTTGTIANVMIPVAVPCPPPYSNVFTLKGVFGHSTEAIAARDR